MVDYSNAGPLQTAIWILHSIKQQEWLVLGPLATNFVQADCRQDQSWCSLNASAELRRMLRLQHVLGWLGKTLSAGLDSVITGLKSRSLLSRPPRRISLSGSCPFQGYGYYIVWKLNSTTNGEKNNLVNFSLACTRHWDSRMLAMRVQGASIRSAAREAT